MKINSIQDDVKKQEIAYGLEILIVTILEFIAAAGSYPVSINVNGVTNKTVHITIKNDGEIINTYKSNDSQEVQDLKKALVLTGIAYIILVLL